MIVNDFLGAPLVRCFVSAFPALDCRAPRLSNARDLDIAQSGVSRRFARVIRPFDRSFPEWKRALLVAALLLNGQAWAGESGSGKAVGMLLGELSQPARRVVSLAPHLTELVYEAGAGDRLVAAVAFSDYPPPAAALPRVGSSHGLDLEAIVALRPDLVLAWRSGNPMASIEKLRELGLTVHLSEVTRLDEMPVLIETLGGYLGTESRAERAADKLRARHRQLLARPVRDRPVSVFYQVLDDALLTLGGQHLVSEIIGLCGGHNVFSSQSLLVPRVDIEAVIKANPRVIVASGEPSHWRVWRERWRAWTSIAAVRDGRIHYIHPDLLHRSGPRVFDGAEQMCAALAR